MTGLIVPVASITCRMSPFSTFAVKYSASVFRESRNAAKTATAKIIARIQIQFRLISPKRSSLNLMALQCRY